MVLTKTAGRDVGVGPKLELRYFNTAQAAAYTGLSTSFLEKLRPRGDGPPFIRIGTRVLYAVHCIDEWMAQRTANSTSEMIACNDNFISKLNEARRG